MAIQQIDLTRYWKLIHCKKKLGKAWWTEENHAKYLELLHYQVMMEREVFFQNRNDYLPLIQKFVEENLDPWEFYSFFRDLFSRDRDQVDVFEQDWQKKRESIFVIDDRAEEFCDCIDSIFDVGEQFNEIDNEKKKFRARVTEIWAEIQNLLQEA